jgi:hypothetical protein
MAAAFSEIGATQPKDSLIRETIVDYIGLSSIPGRPRIKVHVLCHGYRHLEAPWRGGSPHFPATDRPAAYQTREFRNSQRKHLRVLTRGVLNSSAQPELECLLEPQFR